MARFYHHDKNWGGQRPGAGRPLQGTRTRNLSITLPEDLLTAVDQLAYRQGETRSAVIAHYLRRGLSIKEENTDPSRNT